MQWRQEFETCHPALDLEHRKILELIVEFEERLRRAEPLEALEAVLRTLRSRVEGHFAAEERLMETTGFPGCEAHRALHRMLLASLKDMAQELSFRSLTPEALLEFLNDWFAVHTSQEDRELAEYLRSRQTP